MINGVLLYNALTAPGDDAVHYEEFDDCQGHASPNGAYHYHQLSCKILFQCQSFYSISIITINVQQIVIEIGFASNCQYHITYIFKKLGQVSKNPMCTYWYNLPFYQSVSSVILNIYSRTIPISIL